MPSPVYASVYCAVADEGRSYSGYTEKRHDRVHDLVEEWLQTPEASAFGYGSDERSCKARSKACRRWVKQEYKARYGAEEAQAYGCPPLLILWIIGGIISWLAQRTLDWIYPKVSGQTPNIMG